MSARAQNAKVMTGKSALNEVSSPVDTLGALGATLSVKSSAGVSAGVVALEGSPDGVSWTDTALASVTTAAASKLYAASIVAPHRYLRVRISTAITGGTVDAWITTGGFAPAGWMA